MQNRLNEIKTEVVNKLIENNITIATAESCTGGLVSETITSCSGASNVFSFGFVTYSAEAKNAILGVNKSTLEEYGAVSSFTAKEMAQGAKEKANSDIAVSVTGVAGPSKSEGKPVGLVYIALANNENCFSKELNIKPVSREYVKTCATYEVFKLILEFLERGIY